MKRSLPLLNLVIWCSLFVQAQVNPLYFDNNPYKEGHRQYCGAASGGQMFFAQRSAFSLEDTTGELYHFNNGVWKRLYSGSDLPGPAAVNDNVVHRGVFYFASTAGLYTRQNNGQWMRTDFPQDLIPLRIFVDDSVKVIRMNKGLMFQKRNGPWIHYDEIGEDQMVTANYRNFQGQLRRPIYHNGYIFVPFLNSVRIFNTNTREYTSHNFPVEDMGLFESPVMLTRNNSTIYGLYFIEEDGSIHRPGDRQKCWNFSGSPGLMAPKSILSGTKYLITLAEDFIAGPVLICHDHERAVSFKLENFSLNKINSASALFVLDEEEETVYAFSSGRKIRLEEAFNRAQMPLQGSKVLDINDIRLPVSVLGEHGSDPLNQNVRSKMPQQNSAPGCVNSTYQHAAIWIGGLDQGNNLHLSAMTYRQRGKDFVPGPLAVVDGSPIAQAASDFNKVWKVSREEIQQHIDVFARTGKVEQGQTAPDIWTWPGNGPEGAATFMAPFVDRNSNGRYEPNLGDYPDVPGDQCLFFVMNDQTLHTETNGLPLGVEIHGMVYAWNCESPGTTDGNTNRTVFFKYRIFNRSTHDYQQVVFSSFLDTDISPFRDFAASHVTRNLFYGYTNDTMMSNYGSRPPVQGMTFLNAPVFQHDGVDGDDDGEIDEDDERRYMGSFTTFNNDASSNITLAQGYYNRMLGLKADGSALIFGGPSGGSTDRTPYAYSGDSDPAFAGREWTEVSQGNNPGDRRLIASTYPFDLAAGESVSVEMASFFVHDAARKVTEQDLFETVDKIRKWYDEKGRPDCAGILGTSDTEWRGTLAIYPNPSVQTLNIDVYSEPRSVRMTDMSGKSVNLIYQLNANVLSVQTADLKAGVYVIQVTDDNGTRSARFVKL